MRVSQVKATIKNVNREINYIVIMCLAFLMLKFFVLDKITEPVVGMHKVGSLVEGLTSSLLASYIFYLFLVAIPEFRDRSVVLPLIIRDLKSIVSLIDEVVESINSSSNSEIIIPNCSKEEAGILLSKIDLNDKTTPWANFRNGEMLTWKECLLYTFHRIDEISSAIVRHGVYVDAEITNILDKLEKSSLPRYVRDWIKLIEVRGLSGTNMYTLGSLMCDYLEDVEPLRSKIARLEAGLQVERGAAR